MSSSKFWIQRVKEYGHTGWSDNLTYLYDQKFRLKLIDSFINKYFPDGMEKSLDYGCGSGDFTYLLSKYSKSTMGIDIADEIIDIAKKKYIEDNIQFNRIDNISNYNGCDMIVSITVLQHIMSEDDLKMTLNRLYEMLKSNGVLIIIDSYNIDDSDYIKSRDYHKFISMLKSINFQILEEHNLYHPQLYPTKLFEKYRKNIFIRLFNKFSMKKLLDRISDSILEYDNPIIVENSPTKIVVVKKI